MWIGQFQTPSVLVQNHLPLPLFYPIHLLLLMPLFLNHHTHLITTTLPIRAVSIDQVPTTQGRTNLSDPTQHSAGPQPTQHSAGHPNHSSFSFYPTQELNRLPSTSYQKPIKAGAHTFPFGRHLPPTSYSKQDRTSFKTPPRTVNSMGHQLSPQYFTPQKDILQRHSDECNAGR